jgi:hypothetical protein
VVVVVGAELLLLVVVVVVVVVGASLSESEPKVPSRDTHLGVSEEGWQTLHAPRTTMSENATRHSQDKTREQRHQAATAPVV